MQTFLPYPDFARSAESLDLKRLNNQRNEAFIILKTLATGKGWPNHPATKMWRGYELALLDYILAMCDEFADGRQGNVKVDVAEKSILLAQEFYHQENSYIVERYLEGLVNPVMPPWMGNREFHMSHQSNLIRKDAEFYGPKFPGVSAELEYVWPVE